MTETDGVDWITFPGTEAEAKLRFRNYYKKDPLPHVEPALLNASDIVDYVRATGMIHPFYNDAVHLKNASYEAAILGLCIYWDSTGKRRERTLGVGDKLTLEPNSITFVQVEPEFSVPLYLALRFNLKIVHVHRGLLLGTGPLIDPGYEGKLLVPLHNLTTNDYTLTGGEGLIWIEFTKLSRSSEIDREYGTISRTTIVRDFPQEEKRLTPDQALARGAPNREIRSSVGEFVQRAQQAEEHARAAEERLRRLGFIGLVAALISFGSLAVGLGTLYVNLYKFGMDTTATVDKKLNEHYQLLNAFDKRLQKLEARPGPAAN